MPPLSAARRQGRARDRAREVANRLFYGEYGPRVNELIWIDPRSVGFTFESFRAASGRVVRRWPLTPLIPLEEHPHVRFALAHWRDGVPWPDTGVFDYMLERIANRGQQDNCRTFEDVVERYRRLDALYETTRRARRLLTRGEIDPRAHREDGGILIHVGPAGELVLGASGKHRLTIAQLLDLPVIPARVGHIHRDALPLMPRLRRGPDIEAVQHG